MKSGLRIVLWATMVLLLSLDSATTHRLEAADNIAFRKPYALFPAPNYKLCADEDDLLQLTDGKYSQGRLWTQKGTVGWTSARFVEITVDLQTVLPISGLSFNTAAGYADVAWPKQIYVLVSEDGRFYFQAGELVQLSSSHGLPPGHGYAVHRYWTNQLETHGRFVKIVILPDGPFAFTDEIEIYRGDEAFLAKPLTGKKFTDAAWFVNEIEFSRLVQRRLHDDLAAVRRLVVQSSGREDLLNELTEIERKIADVQVAPVPEFRTVLPLHQLHQRIFVVQAAVWRSLFHASLVIWQKPRWDMVLPTEVPGKAEARVNVIMMENEYRSAAFNISNCDSLPETFHLSFTGIPGGIQPPYISVHDVPFTDTRSGVPVMAALPAAESDTLGYRVRIEPGLTRQIWLTCSTKKLGAGEYLGRIMIQPGSHMVPFRLRVYPLALPDQLTLHLAGWDYTDRDTQYDVTSQNRQALIQHLQERFVDSPWATRSVLPSGEYDKAGNMLVPPSPARFKKWIERWPGARNFFVYAAIGPRFAGFPPAIPAFRNALKNWTLWWARQLQEYNIRPQQLKLLLVDEPKLKQDDDLIIAYGQAIQEAQSGIEIWEDTARLEPWLARPALFQVCDALCPQMSVWIDQGRPFADFYLRQQGLGKALWFYSCSGATKLRDPYAYYLMQQWFCWKFSARGSAFWAFGDSDGASSWNEYAARSGASTPLFLDPATVTAGKHMEAIREGVEDFEYLAMLQRRIEELEKKQIRNPAVAAAKHLLSQGVERVTGIMTSSKLAGWLEAKDRTIADQVRGEVLEHLMTLRSL
jgi:hypothetical protein